MFLLVVFDSFVVIPAHLSPFLSQHLQRSTWWLSALWPHHLLQEWLQGRLCLAYCIVSGAPAVWVRKRTTCCKSADLFAVTRWPGVDLVGPFERAWKPHAWKIAMNCYIPLLLNSHSISQRAPWAVVFPSQPSSWTVCAQDVMAIWIEETQVHLQSKHAACAM